MNRTWKLFFAILTISLPFMTPKSGLSAFLLLTALPFPFSANLLLPQKSTLYRMGIPERAFTVCI